MSITIILTIVTGVGVGVLAFFIVKMVISPKRLSAVAELIKQGRYQAAERAARALIAKDQRHGPARYFLGLVYLAENKPELALMEFKAVNQIGQFDQDLPEREFRKKTAALFEKFGQLEEALKEYILLTQLEPNNGENYYNAGAIFDDRGNGEVAIKYLRKSLELDSRNAQAHFRLGTILYRSKHPLEARDELEAALKNDPSIHDANYFLGKIHKENSDNTAALLSFEKAQKSQTYKQKSLIERGGCYMSMGGYEKAIIELERAIKLTKDEASNDALYGRYFLAVCYEKTRNLDRAIEQWEKIYVRKPNFKDVAEKLSQYQEYRTDDRMKDFLTCSKDSFVELCRKLAMYGLSFAVRDEMDLPNGVDFITVENDSEKWMGVKKMPRLLRFVRVSDTLDDTMIRSLLEKMKKLNIIRGSILTNVNFNRTALEFAENRPVELFAKEKLQELLAKIPVTDDQSPRPR
ncbi:MAG: tetratricopeptide repeat protein [Spirochaetes bacterium]|nr:tetratricopeptide repeat protein [Spirochaetota bacterium]